MPPFSFLNKAQDRKKKKSKKKKRNRKTVQGGISADLLPVPAKQKPSV